MAKRRSYRRPTKVKAAQAVPTDQPVKLDLDKIRQMIQLAKPQVALPVQPIQQQPPSFEDICRMALEQALTTLEQKWEKGSPGSYATFKVGGALYSSPQFPAWLRNFGGLLVMGGVLGGLEDLERAIDRKPLRLN